MATENRTEAPTPRHRQKEREKGRVARSQDLTAVLCLVAVLLTLNFAGGSIVQAALRVTAAGLMASAPEDFTVSWIMASYRQWLQRAFVLLGPLLAAAAVAAVLVNLAQTRFVFSFYPLQPRLERLSLAQGCQRLFSLRSLVRGLVSSLQVGLVLLVAGLVVRAYLPPLISAAAGSVLGVVLVGIHVTTQVVIKCCLVMVVLGAIDYAYQYYEHEKSLRMTRYEVRQELRESEGDPLLVSRRRRMRREMIAGMISAEMPQATALVTNPTEIAVALRYEETMSAPKIVAKGRGAIAERIVQLARIYNVPIERNRPLARSLYRLADVGELIPESLYEAVAQILAIIYRRQEQLRARLRPL